MIEICNRWTDAVILRDETATTMREALERAIATGANLTGANLAGADLAGANLAGANLAGANGLDEIAEDIYEILSDAPCEVRGLLSALRDGRVDGSTYSGECACLVGTIANVRGCTVAALAPVGIVAQASRPAERWFLAIRKGDTPATNQVAALTEAWIEGWLLSNAEIIAACEAVRS